VLGSVKASDFGPSYIQDGKEEEPESNALPK